MKINFDANFGAIKKVIDKPLSTGSENSGEFRRLLADISPELKVKSQNPDNVTKIPVETQFPSVMMGRLDPKSTELFGPELTALVPDESQVSSYSSSSDLKEALTPPKIIEGRRITDSEVEKIYRLSRTEREEQVRGIMASAAKRHGVDPALGMAVALTESSFNPKAVSSDGYATKGLMQLLDSTGKLQLKRNDLNHAYKPFDPNQNVDLGVGYLRYLHELFSEDTELPNKLKTVAAENSTSLEKLAVAAYNAGEGRVAQAQAQAERDGKNPSIFENVRPYLPDSTQDYVDKVFASIGRFQSDFNG